MEDCRSDVDRLDTRFSGNACRRQSEEMHRLGTRHRPGKCALAAAIRWIGVLLLTAWGLFVHARAGLAVTAPQQIHRLLQVYSALLDYRAGQPPLVGAWGKLELGLEVIPMPTIDSRVGAKTEPPNPMPLIPRPRALFGLGAGFTVGGLFVPPVTVMGNSALLTGFDCNTDCASVISCWGRAPSRCKGNWTAPFPIPQPPMCSHFKTTGQTPGWGMCFGSGRRMQGEAADRVTPA